MKRMTDNNKNHVCRIDKCMAEDWMFDLYGNYSDKFVCDNCPFEKYINHLAELEDEKELFEDDLK